MQKLTHITRPRRSISAFCILQFPFLLLPSNHLGNRPSRQQADTTATSSSEDPGGGLPQAMAQSHRAVSENRFRSPTRELTPNPSRHLGQLLLALFDVAVRVELRHATERHEMKVNVRHAQAFDGHADPFRVRDQS